MAQSSSISFDEVLTLLRSPVLHQFEGVYAERRGCSVNPNWLDSVQTTKELAFAGISKADLEVLLTIESPLLTAFMEAQTTLPDDGEEYPEGEEPEEDENSFNIEVLPVMLRGFALRHACCLWLLKAHDHSKLIASLKFQRVPFHRKHAGDLRRLFDLLMSEKPGTEI